MPIAVSANKDIIRSLERPGWRLCLSGLFVYLCISPIIYLIMQLTHIAIWTNELERSRDFYVKYFGGRVMKSM